MSKMSDGGKGSAPRPFSVSQAEYESRWDVIFGRDQKEDNTGVQKTEYYDIMTTEQALVHENQQSPNGGMVDTGDLKSPA